MSQSKKSSSFPSKRAAQLLKELQDQRLQSQQSRQRLIGNWYQQMANKEIRDPAPEKETFPGTVIGYRAFGVRVYAPDPPAVQYLLHPVGRLNMPSWTPGWNQAECAEHRDWGKIVGHGLPPSRHCGCGFWSFYDPSNLHPGVRFSISQDVGAVIEGAGRVYLHTKGFRAERARVKALFALRNVSRDVGPAVAAAYGVDFYHSRGFAEKVFPPTNPKDFGIMPEIEANTGDWLGPPLSGWGSPPTVQQLYLYHQALTGRIRFPNG